VELIPYLSAVIFIATIATVVLATLSYAAFKLRNKRRPKTNAARPVYFRRVEPPSTGNDGSGS
jgi:hypothetical protein